MSPGGLAWGETFFFVAALLPDPCEGLEGLLPDVPGFCPAAPGLGVLAFAIGVTSGELLPPAFLLFSGDSALAIAWLLDLERFGALVSWIKSILLSMEEASLLAIARRTPLSEVDNLTISLLPPIVPSR